MKDTIGKFLLDLFESEAFRTALMTVLTTVILIIGAKLRIYLNELTAKAKLSTRDAVKNSMENTAKDLIVTAEKRSIQNGKTKENWVADMLKSQFAKELGQTTISDNEIQALIQQNYEKTKQSFDPKRWEELEQKNRNKPMDMIDNELKGKKIT